MIKYLCDCCKAILTEKDFPENGVVNERRHGHTFCDLKYINRKFSGDNLCKNCFDEFDKVSSEFQPAFKELENQEFAALQKVVERLYKE